jgi:hypothetical protein
LLVGEGGGGNNLIYGNFGNDELDVGGGNSTAYGGQGNDHIIEGFGPSDRLFGNLGADTFDFSDVVQPQNVTQATANHVSDFSDAQGDRVDVPTPPGGIHYVEVQGDSAVVSVETAVGFAETHNSAGAIVPPPGMFAQGNVVFVAGVTDGYLLVDADNSGTFGGPNDFAIVLDHLNNTTLFGPGDVI